MTQHNNKLSPSLLLNAYAQGVFPMSDDADDDDFFWVEPKMRGIIPLEHFHIPKSLLKKIKKKPFDIYHDRDFKGVISGCAEETAGREVTWINRTIKDAYQELFELGYCHTIEAWQGDKLVGGLYGISLGSAFFGESMFSRKTDASKICLVALVQHLNKTGFTLLDTQFITPHLEQFGAIEIPQTAYIERLNKALTKKAIF